MHTPLCLLQAEEAAEAAKAAAEGAALPPVVEEKEEGATDPSAPAENIEQDETEKAEVWLNEMSAYLGTYNIVNWESKIEYTWYWNVL